MSKASKFYDDYTVQQTRVGINSRHFSIIAHLEKTGMKPDYRVLEVGCGIGTLSELILRYLSPRGFLHAVDISPKSVELANQRLNKYRNTLIEEKDLTNESIRGYFDVIVLPDVIEHIPFKSYPGLFKNLYRLLTDNGFIFIHIPHPNYLEWLIKTNSKQLQFIDQPVYTDHFLKLVYPIGFYLHHLMSNSIYDYPEDYQMVILKKKLSIDAYRSLAVPFRVPFFTRLRKKTIYLLRGRK